MFEILNGKEVSTLNFPDKINQNNQNKTDKQNISFQSFYVTFLALLAVQRNSIREGPSLSPPPSDSNRIGN